MAKKKKYRKLTAAQKLHRKRSLASKRGWKTRRLNAKRAARKPSNHLWRVTIAAPYYRRTGKKRSEYRAFAYMVRAWFRTKQEAKNAKGLIAKAKIGRKRVLTNKPATWFLKSESINIERATKVPYDARLFDIIEEQDERPL